MVLTNVRGFELRFNGELVDKVPGQAPAVEVDKREKQNRIEVSKGGYERILFELNHPYYKYKELNFDLLPVPANVDPETLETVGCTSVNFKLQPGTHLGDIYGLKHPQKIVWDETSNVTSYEAEVHLNNVMNTYGYPVPGLQDKFNGEDKAPRFQLKAEVEQLEANEYSATSLNAQGAIDDLNTDRLVKTVVNWTLYDNRKKKVVLESTTEASVWGNRQSFQTVLLLSLGGALKRLLAEQSMIKILERNEAPTVQPEDFSKLSIPLVIPPQKLTEVIEAAITVDMGDGHGSGFIVSETGYALTNYHVVGNEKNVEIILSNGIALNGEVVRTNEEFDVALIKIKGRGFRPAAIGKEQIQVGANIIAVGTPRKKELGQSLSRGIISGRREIEGKVYLQADISVSPGNSGGPLLNEKNEVIGIVNSKLMGHGVEGIGFAIPIEVALEKLGITVL